MQDSTRKLPPREADRGNDVVAIFPPGSQTWNGLTPAGSKSPTRQSVLATARRTRTRSGGPPFLRQGKQVEPIPGNSRRSGPPGCGLDLADVRSGETVFSRAIENQLQIVSGRAQALFDLRRDVHLRRNQLSLIGLHANFDAPRS